MSNLGEKILDFYQGLSLDEELLPPGVKVMNPYSNASDEVARVLKIFHQKYFADHEPRQLILGINPGRFGAGITGIPFTDTPTLKNNCGIETRLETRETSAEFVYKCITAFGGAKAFYARWYIGAVCPLGFLHLNTRGRWVNWNYYDQPELENALYPFMVRQLIKQKNLCGNPEKCLVLGTGKNYHFLKKLNHRENLFREIIPLEHPRYVMQYKRKEVDKYIAKFLRHLKT